MIELICNIHIHSRYSDGSGSFSEIASAALSAGTDVIITTDHNILVKGVEKYYQLNGSRLLHLTGEEVHDANLDPQHNHALVLGAANELSHHAWNPQLLIDQTHNDGGMIFLAHPFENSLPLFHEPAITWNRWDIDGFNGIELWNGLSEFKTVARNFPLAVYFAFFPRNIPHNPSPEALKKWDDLLCAGKRVTAVTGSDAHALLFHRGLFRKTLFPYQYHFSAINNHLLVSEALSGDLETDKHSVYSAFASGSSFIGYDQAAPTKGFRFYAENDETIVNMGGQIKFNKKSKLIIKLPSKAECFLIRNGQKIELGTDDVEVEKKISEPGVYRVEAYRYYAGKKRAWIFSNPIYIQ